MTFFKYIILLVFILILSGCAPTSHYIKVENNIMSNDYNGALSTLEKVKDTYGDRNAVLYWMDKGIILHFAGKYEESNEVLAKAEIKIEELYTKSITGAIGSMLLNDLTLPYEGEDFEKVMVNLFMAMNYIYLNKFEDALVEIRKIDNKLNVYNTNYEKKNLYDADAFGRYLGGILYEVGREPNDAFISYRNAYEVFTAYQSNYGIPIPNPVIKDILRITEALHFNDEHETYFKKYSNLNWAKQDELKNKGEFIIFIMQGFAPKKEEYTLRIAVPDEKTGVPHYVKLAFPKFVPRPTDIGYSRVTILPTNETKDTYLIENITAIAKQNLEDRIDRIYAKTLIRVAAKTIATEIARKKASESSRGLGAIVGLASIAYAEVSEQADTRSWRLLPAEIYIARIPVEPGIYDLEISFLSNSGYIINKKYIQKAEIKKGEKKFFTVRVF